MLAAQFSTFGRPDEVVTLIDLPDPGEPGPGEAIVDAELSPINPSDLMNFEGVYGAERPVLPMIPGNEGVGRVVRVGAGVSNLQVGDRVLLPGPGTWRERFRAPAAALFALPAEIDPRQLAMLRVNPPTAWLLLNDFVPAKPGQWLIQNAANSGVGHLLIRLAREAGVKTINVVRRPELVAPLRAAGADVVVVDGPDLDLRVRAEIGGGALPLAIDAVGGDATMRLARCVDDRGTVVNYGALAGEPCRVDPRETIFRDVSLRGFWLRHWFMRTPPDGIAAMFRTLCAKIASGTLAVDVEAVYPARQIREAVAHAARGARSGKILLSFNEG
ncbi:MAG: hypothetical protein RIS35_2933 [Pseudomonadota bacterium]